MSLSSLHSVTATTNLPGLAADAEPARREHPAPVSFRPVLVETAPERRVPAGGDRFRSVNALLVEVCRAAGAELEGTRFIVDCDPARLEISDWDVERFSRCATLLLDAALAGRAPAEVDLSAQATGTAESPLLLISIRTLAEVSSGEERPVAWAERGPVHVARIQMRRSVGTLLVSHRSRLESRFSLGLELSTRLSARRAIAPIAPMEAKILIADDNSRARRAYRRLLEAEGYAVREATRPLELVAHLDPDETMGLPPSWLLLDEGWIGSGRGSRVGLVDLVEASLPPDRVLLLANPGAGEPGAPEAWDRLEKPFAPADLLERLRPSERESHLRNAEAEMPYSLSRW